MDKIQGEHFDSKISPFGWKSANFGWKFMKYVNLFINDKILRVLLNSIDLLHSANSLHVIDKLP